MDEGIIALSIVLGAAMLLIRLLLATSSLPPNG
jgi:hypothetical protein